MQIEVQNLIIIALVLIAVAVLFSLRKKLIVAGIIIAIALAFFGRAFWLEQAIKKAEELKQNTQQMIDKVNPANNDLNLNLDVDKMAGDVKDAAKDALPDNLYRIDENKKGFGLDEPSEDEEQNELVEKALDFIGDTNK